MRGKRGEKEGGEKKGEGRGGTRVLRGMIPWKNGMGEGRGTSHDSWPLINSAHVPVLSPVSPHQYSSAVPYRQLGLLANLSDSRSGRSQLS